MNNHMSLKLVGANSSLEINSPITSIYLQEELTGLTTLPGIRETKGMNIGMDGGWTSAQFYEPRLITIKGVIANQDVAVVEQRRKQLIQLLAEKRLALEFQTEAGNHYTMNVVVAGVQMPLSKVLTASYFQLNLRADDPLIYDNNALAELEAILRRSSSASSGFTINFPINFQLGTSESRPTIDNFGSSVIYPTITLTGPLTTPEIVNITTNMAFTIDEVLGAGTYAASGIRGAMAQEGSVDTYSGNPIQAARDAESPISKFSLYGNATQGRLPAEYQEIEYIEALENSDNIGRYIDTGVQLGTNNFEISVGIKLLPSSAYEKPYFSIWTSSYGYWNVFRTYNNLDCYTQAHHYISNGALDNTYYDMKLTRNDSTWTLSNGVDTATTWTYTPSSLNNTTLKINTRGDLNDATKSSAQYYYVKVKVAGELVRDYIPAKRKSDGKIGLYDTVNNNFVSSAGTGEFTAGVSVPNPGHPQNVNTVTGENVVKIEGKNLFDLQASTRTDAGVVFTKTTDTITAIGTTTRGTYAESLSIYDNFSGLGNYPVYATTTATNSFQLPAGTYTFSANITNTGNTTGGLNIGVGTLGARVSTSTKLEKTAGQSGTASATISVADGQYVLLSVWYEGTANTPNVNLSINQVQLEHGNSASQFEPYQGQDYEVNLGKNLLQITENSTTINGTTFTVNSDGSITVSGTPSATANFVFSQQVFTPQFASIISANDIPVGSSLVVKRTTAGGTITYPSLLYNGSNSYNLTVGSTYEQFLLRIQSTFAGTATFKFQIERGSTATTYAPYFTPIELAKIGTYQDRIYKNDGKWYVEKQVGKVAININGYNSSYTNVDYAIFDKPTDALNYDTYSVMPALCESAVSPETTGGYNQTAQIGRLCSQANKTHLWIGVAKGTTQATAKTMLDGKSVYYALATPTTTEITNEALIAQLDAILEAHLYEGLNNISNVTISPNLSGDLEIKTGQTLTVINSLSIVGSSGTAEIGLGGSEIAMVGSVADELTINGTTGAVTKTARIGKIESYAGETITTDYISTSGGLDSDATIYYVLPSSSTSVINTLDSTALAAFNNVVASGGVSAQTNIGSISVDVTTVTAQDVAVVDTKQHTVTINGVGAYSKFSGDWLTLDVGLNELQLITENNTDTGSAVIKYRVGYMGV